MMTTLFGGIEAGGTKFVCAVGTSPTDIRAEHRFPTTTPEETIGEAMRFFRQQEAAHGKLTAIGVAAFGPLDPTQGSPTYGHITTTPKPHWGNTDVVGPLAAAFGVPVGFDTDVNGAALGEHRWGAGQGLETFVYLTIGTGIGGGGLVNGRLMHGLIHPEMGHMHLPHNLAEDPYQGHCPYHGDCWEGLCCGPALAARWGKPAYELPADHPAWPLQAKYLAYGLVNIITILSPQRIIMGGGVMEQPQLFPLMRQNVQKILNGYVQAPQILHNIDEYIVPPALGNKAGLSGAFALAEQSIP